MTDVMWAWAKHLKTLVMRGPDALDFCHRMSTADIKALAVGDGALAGLTDKRGRLIDLVQLVRLEPEVVWVVHSASVDVIAWLDGFLFSEELELQDQSAQVRVRHLFGGGALAACGGAARWAPWGARPIEQGAALRSFDLVTSAGETVPSVLWLSPKDAPLPPGAQEVSAEALAEAYLAAGVPRAPGEISDAYNPLELGLDDAISWTKGCYIGQEAISRIDTRDKRKRELLLFTHDGAVQVDDAVQLPGERTPIGRVTSASAAYALAPCLRGRVAPGDEVLLGEREGRCVPRLAKQRPHD